MPLNEELDAIFGAGTSNIQGSGVSSGLESKLNDIFKVEQQAPKPVKLIETSPKPKSLFTRTKGFFKSVEKEASRFASNVDSGFLNTLSSLGHSMEWLSSESLTLPLPTQIQRPLEKVGKTLSDKSNEWSQILQGARIDDKKATPNFIDVLEQGAGSAASFFLPGLGTMGGAGLIARVSPRIAILFGGAVSTALESMAEAGDSYDGALKAGKSKAKANRIASGVFGTNIVLNAILNRIGIFNPNTKGIIRKALMSMPAEGVQEAAQQIIQNVGAGKRGKDIWEGVFESGAVGAILGGIMGGGAGMLEKNDQIAINDAQKQKIAEQGMAVVEEKPQEIPFVPPMMEMTGEEEKPLETQETAPTEVVFKEVEEGGQQIEAVVVKEKAGVSSKEKSGVLFAEALKGIVTEAQKIQTEFLDKKGLTWDEVRAWPKEKQDALQKEWAVEYAKQHVEVTLAEKITTELPAKKTKMPETEKVEKKKVPKGQVPVNVRIEEKDVEMFGVPLKIQELDFVAVEANLERGKYQVIEPQTGRPVGFGKTRKAAIADAERLIGEKGVEATRAKIAEVLKERQKQPKKPVSKKNEVVKSPEKNISEQGRAKVPAKTEKEKPVSKTTKVEVGENASEFEKKVAAEVAKKQEAKKFKDVGKKFFGAKKDMAAMRRISSGDLAKLEENAKVAFKHITKENVLGGAFEVNKAGTPQLEYIKWRVYKEIPTRPADSAEARKWYVDNIPGLVEMFKVASTLEEITAAAKFWDEKMSSELNYSEYRDLRELIHDVGNITQQQFDRGYISVYRSRTASGHRRKPLTLVFQPDFKFLEPKAVVVGEKQTPIKREVLTHIIRKGGRDIGNVTPERLIKEFGHRGVEYGNWMKDVESKVHIRRYGEAMADLEQILGFDIAQFNKLRNLGISFGSRGGGFGSAHYEPSTVVINITKTRGDGTVAHEWGHYFDNTAARESGGTIGYGSKGQTLYDSPLEKPFENVMNAIYRGDKNARDVVERDEKYSYWKGKGSSWGLVDRFLKEAKLTPQEVVDRVLEVYSEYRPESAKGAKYNKFIRRMTEIPQYVMWKRGVLSVETQRTSTKYFEVSKKRGEYWSSPQELFARAWEGYIKTKGLEMGIENNYLVNLPEGNDLWVPVEERPAIHKEMDVLVKTTKEALDLNNPPVRGEKIKTMQIENIDTGKKEIAEKVKEKAKPQVPVEVPVEKVKPKIEEGGEEDRIGKLELTAAYFSFSTEEQNLIAEGVMPESQKVIAELYLNRYGKDALAELQKIQKAQKEIDIYDTNINSGEGDTGGGIPNVVGVGEDTSGHAGTDTQVNVTEVRREGQAEGVGGGDGELGAGDGTPSGDDGSGGGVNAIVEGLAQKSRLALNKQVEAIIDAKAVDNSGWRLYSSDIYSQQEKDVMRRYSGYGGVRARGEETSGALDEFFTPQKVVQFVWDRVFAARPTENWRQARILEPSVGTGNFIAYSPLEASSFQGYEVNKYSAVVASVLNPGADIERDGDTPTDFTSLFIDESDKTGNHVEQGSKDVVIGNPPYGKYAGRAKGLGEGTEFATWEEYFIGRGLTQLKPGGTLAMVVPSSFLRGGNTKGKEAIAKLGTLIEAWRLPNGIFKTTDVGTDVVIFERKEGTAGILSGDAYFSKSNNVLGKEGMRRGRFGEEAFVEGSLENIPTPDQARWDAAKQSAQTSPYAGKQEKPIAQQAEESAETEALFTAKPADLKKITIEHKIAKPVLLEHDNSKWTPAQVKGFKFVEADGSTEKQWADTLTAEEKEKYFSYNNGRWFVDEIYVDGRNLYGLLEQLEIDKDAISQAQYDKQKSLIEKLLPQWTKTEEIGVAPQSPFWDEISEDGDSVRDLFKQYIRKLPGDALEGLSKYELGQYISEEKMPVEKNEERKMYRQKLMTRMANKYFKLFKSEISATNPKLRAAIEYRYNREMNAYVAVDHSKFPQFAPVNDKFRGVNFVLNSGQKRGLGFALARGRGIDALDMGVGKTLVGTLVAQEEFHKGKARRLMIAMPNKSIGDQWIETIKDILPEATIYDAREKSDVLKVKGQKLAEKSITLITESGLLDLSLSADAFTRIQPDLMEMLSGDESTPRAKEQLKQKVKELMASTERGSRVNIDELGIDYLIVDEAHRHNHIIESVKGAGRGSNPYSGLKVKASQKGKKMFMLSRHILQSNKNRGVLLLTGTPMQNNVLEMYSMLSLVGREDLQEMGVMKVKDFAERFIKIEKKMVVKANMEVEYADVVTGFSNYDALRQLLSKNMIKISGDEAGVVRPERIDRRIFVEATQEQKDLGHELAVRMTEARAKLKGLQRGSDEALALQSEVLRLMTGIVRNSFSPYATNYFHGEAPDGKGFVEGTPKVLAALKFVQKGLELNPEGRHLIYTGITENEKIGLNFPEAMKNYLVGMGLKANEIGIIQGSTSKNARKANKEAFNNIEKGKPTFKVLIGTNTIIEGLDLQKKTSDVYVLTPFWNYTQFKQLAGRAWRQGNDWAKLNFHLLSSKNTGDVFITEKILQKEKRDMELTRALASGGRFTDIEGDEIDMEEAMSTLLNDPVMETQLAQEKEQGDIAETIAALSITLQRNQDILEGNLEREQMELIESGQNNLREATIDFAEKKNMLENATDELGKQRAQEAINTVKNTIARSRARIKDAQAKIQNLLAYKEQEKITPKTTKALEAKIEALKGRQTALKEKYGKLLEEARTKRATQKMAPTDYDALVAQFEKDKQGFYVAETRVGGVAEETADVAMPEITKPEPAPAGEATVGGFVDDFPVELAQMENLHPIDFPELVELAHELTGKYPETKKLPRAKGFHKEGRLVLNRDLFKEENRKDLPKVLAHELGHLIDWLPDLTTSRGNILGRLFTLRKFMKNTFGELEVTNKDLRKELMGVSEWWRPYDKETATVSFTKYRNSAKELYADAVSILFNTPGTLQKMAPEFYKQFFAELDRKPEVLVSYTELQEILSQGRDAVIGEQMKKDRAMFKKGEDLIAVKRAEGEKRKRDILFNASYVFNSKNEAVNRKVAQAKQEGRAVRDELNMTYILRGHNYFAGKMKAMLESKVQPIQDVLNKYDIAWDTFGLGMLYRRVMIERKEIANTRGLTPENAKERWDRLMTDLGEKKGTVLQMAIEQMRDAVHSVLIDTKTLHTPEKLSQMLENEAYATFRVLDYIEDPDYVPASIKPQVGSLKEIANPATATVLKLISQMYAAERNHLRIEQRDFMREYHADDFKEAPLEFDGKRQAPKESPVPGEELITYLEDGKLKGYYVDEYTAASFKYDNSPTIKATAMILRKLLLNTFFRQVYVAVSPGFQIANFFFRDFKSFWKFHPKMTMWKTLKLYRESAKPSYNRAFGIKDELITKMEEEEILSITYNEWISGEDSTDAKQLNAIMRRYGLLEDALHKDRPLVNRLTKILETMQRLGNMFETIPKVAGYKFLTRLPDGERPMPNELADMVRTRAGSPDFLNAGAYKAITNEVWLFSTAIKEGIRRDYEMAVKDPKTRASWWWKTAKGDILPKILMYGALLGYFGDELKKLFQKVAEYDLSNYIVVPMGWAKNGKAIIMRIPQDETGRFISGVVWKLLRMADAKDKRAVARTGSQLFEYGAGQLPSQSPMIQLVQAVSELFAGQNPRDWFYGRNVLTDDEFKAGGKYAMVPFMRWAWNQVGGGLVYRFEIHEKTPTEGGGLLSMVLKTPVINGIVGRFIKETDAGEAEKNREVLEGVEGEKSVERIETRRTINKYVEQYQKSARQEADYESALKGAAREVLGDKVLKKEYVAFRKKFETAAIRGKADANLNSLISATTRDAQIELLKDYKQRLGEDEFKDLFLYAQKHKIISIETAKQYKETK